MLPLLTFLTALLRTVLIDAAWAVEVLPPVICEGLANCPGGGAQFVQPQDVLFEKTLPEAIRILINLAAGGAVIFTVWGGVQMLLSMGDETKITKGKQGVIYALLGLGLALVSQTIVEFVSTENYGQGNNEEFLFGGLLPAAVRIILLLFNVAFLIVLMFAGTRMVLSGGKSDEYTKGTATIRWAIIGAIVVNLGRALVEAFLNLNL
ncbi:MAG: hypothetical protein Q7R81_00790 [Candidatus Peregrinibacteria bacterium]|nr:hypothetical protein [Candidatus Peregrinibacteria bacterium]